MTKTIRGPHIPPQEPELTPADFSGLVTRVSVKNALLQEVKKILSATTSSSCEKCDRPYERGDVNGLLKAMDTVSSVPSEVWNVEAVIQWMDQYDEGDMFVPGGISPSFYEGVDWALKYARSILAIPLEAPVCAYDSMIENGAVRAHEIFKATGWHYCGECGVGL